MNITIIKAFFITLVITLISCMPINTTYIKQGELYGPIDSIQFATIKGLNNINDNSDAQVSVVGSSPPIEGVITGHLLKNGISTISNSKLSELNDKQLSKSAIVEWGVSGRNSRGITGISSGYSQEVTVLIRNAFSGELLYKGTGEYMGATDSDDLKGALLAALANFKSTK